MDETKGIPFTLANNMMTDIIPVPGGRLLRTCVIITSADFSKKIDDEQINSVGASVHTIFLPDPQILPVKLNIGKGGGSKKS